MKLLPFDHAVRNLGRSPKRLALVVGGSALVSLLVLGATSFARGMERALGTSGLATNALLLGSGSEESVERSEIPASTASILAASVDGLAVAAGAPAVSPEIHAALPVARTDAPDAAEPAPVPVRGIEPAAFLVHPQVRLAEGRWPARGADEVAAARGTLRRLGDPAIGETLVVAGTPCALVGVFEAPGTAMHGELWMRLDRLAAITLRSTHSCVVAALGEAEFDDVDAFAASRIDLETIAMLESDYYARLGEFFAPIRVLVLATALLVSLGGILGGVNAMYAAFASRVREVGMLQALGFSRGAVAVSLLVESTIACLAGALIACAAGLALLDGVSIDYSMGSFGLSVDASAVAAALATGLLLGLVGALPAIARSLLLPITHALRA